ncbi:MAG: serine protease [Lentisphaeraceae bacterium]|nr:serine protease [Lentisphaeraceae bacterium]
MPEPEPVVPDYYKASTIHIKSEKGRGSSVYLGNGYILTAAHVISKLHESVFIKMGDLEGRAEVIKVDYEKDLALLKSSNINAPAVTVANSEPAELELVHIVGYSLGDSKQKRVLESQYVGCVLSRNIYPAEVTVGFSGGPVFNSKGELVSVVFYRCGFSFEGQFHTVALSFNNKSLRSFLSDYKGVQ